VRRVQGFDPQLFHLFPGYRSASDVSSDSARLSVHTPQVLATAREHLACSTLASVPMEDDGPTGFSRSHWDQSLFEVRCLYVLCVASCHSSASAASASS
jgi:Leishmanolysin